MEQRPVFWLMMRLQHAYFESVRAELQGGEVDAHPRQGPILITLLYNDGMSQAGLSKLLHVSAATVAVSLSRLEKLGYVRRERDQHNHRVNVLRLTDEGKQEAHKLEDIMRNVQKRALCGLDERLLGGMENGLEQMLTNLQNGEEKE